MKLTKHAYGSGIVADNPTTHFDNPVSEATIVHFVWKIPILSGLGPPGATILGDNLLATKRQSETVNRENREKATKRQSG
jgi:hypothetical protein